MRLSAAMAALALPLLSGGCVAALLPLAAAGGMASTRSGDNESASAIAAAETANVGADTASNTLLSTPMTGDGAEYTVTDLTDLPPPSGSGIAPSSNSEAQSGYMALAEFAVASATADPSLGPRKSAILRDSSRLLPDMIPCFGQQAAVIIDLDPAESVLNTGSAVSASADLKQAVRLLTDNDIEVLWISKLPVKENSAVSSALRIGGVADTDGYQLLLTSDAGERKHALIRDAASRYCILAIAGDKRGDFDELFDYLKDASAAFALDGLIGKGWFLASPPLSAEDKSS